MVLLPLLLLFSQTLPAVSCENLSEIMPFAKEYEVIGIDEGQFFADVVSNSNSNSAAAITTTIRSSVVSL